MHHEAQNILDLEEQCNLVQEVYWILFMSDLGASMVTLKGLSTSPWSLCVEDKCIQECVAEKDNEEGKYLSTLDLKNVMH